MPVTHRQAIKNFLLNVTSPDQIAQYYEEYMEVQVNVGQDGGMRIDGEFKGKHWHGWTDDVTTWKSFRIPWNAATEPSYTDKFIKFDLADHAEGIGMTGWDWERKVSRWVAFDFDSIVSHKAGLTTNELNEIQEKASKVPWVSVYSSTSGNGLHFYVFLDPAVPTQDHNEHAALARAVLGQLAAVTGYDFTNKVDICGGNMWVWHRKMHPEHGLQLIKAGDSLDSIPANWRDHVKVITGRRRKNLPQTIEQKTKEMSDVDILFEELTGQYVRETMDDGHKKLIDFLRNNECLWWWDQDNNMLVTHTVHLKEAYESLNLRGIFNTNSTGKEHGRDHNCFAFPLRKGGWVVRRFTPGVKEHESWDQDGGGWTRCYFNTDPNLSTVSRSYDGVEHPSGGYVFREADSAQKAALLLGADLALPTWALGRPAKLKAHKDGRLTAELDKENTDNPTKMTGWIPDAKKWKRIFNVSLTNSTESEARNYDDVIRHLVSEQAVDCGWVIKADSRWVQEPVTHVKFALQSLGLKTTDVSSVLGDNVFKRWTIVNKPFQPEYPGDRQWNRDACQLQFYPSKKDNLNYPTWMKILNHVGISLTDALKDMPWAVNNNILTGADYLKCWIASLFKDPFEPLPYLFLFGPESGGKSIFHEALSLLITNTGYQDGSTALMSQGNFNAELTNAIICFVEELNLTHKNKVAYTRIKNWVTADLLPIHPKGGTPYLSRNTTHWIQCSNDISFCPVFPGDTRITMLHVNSVPKEEWENKRELMTRLRKEAPDFLGELMRLELPESTDRLNVPVVETAEKAILQKQNQSALEQFIDERCFTAPGYFVKLSEFYDEFIKWCDPAEAYNWSKHKIGKVLPLPYVKGRMRDAQFYLGNISLTEPTDTRKPLTVINNKLIPKEE